MRKVWLLLLCFLLVLSVRVGALTWNEALSLAERNSNELISAQKELESSEWTYRKAWSTFLPQLSASAGLTNTQSATSSAWSDSYSFGLSASQNLFKGMAGIYGIQSAYSAVEYQKAGLTSTKASVYYDLRSNFVEVLVAQENVGLLEQILKQRQENSSLIQLRYDSGKEDKGNLMTTKADEA
ncbi:MAG: TolC family protein, partial [Candidatus Margulisbacteria bacterium]|nr:TolC family protein [Candidatus Margulisiibacteriota bacterium]